MSEVSAKDVAALRKASGAGMMDCKRALVESEGDLERAKTWLREKGLSGASKRAGRLATQGAVEVVVEGSVGAVVELNCETDFVAKGDDLTAIVASLTDQVMRGTEADLKNQPYSGSPESSVGDIVAALGSRVGENVSLGRVARFEASGGIVDGYQHIQNGRGTIGVLVELSGVDPSDEKARTVAHDIALHIASAAPRWTRREDVPEEVVAQERAVLETLSRNEGKPEAALPKIIEGRIGGFFKDSVLVEQGFVRDPKVTITKLLSDLSPDAQIVRFARIKVGDE